MANDDTEEKTSDIPLGRVLGALLRDIAHAQHISNQYTVQNLAKQYQADPLLQCLPVPNGSIQELEVDFDLGVVGLKETPPTLETQKNAALDVAAVVARNLGIAVFDHFKQWLKEILAAQSLSGEDMDVVAMLDEQLLVPKTADTLRALLARRICDVLRKEIAEQNDLPEAETLACAVLDVVVMLLKENEDAAGLVERAAASARVVAGGGIPSLQDRIVSEIKSQIEMLFKETQRRNRKRGLSLLVSTELADSPVVTKGKFRIKANLREYRWTASIENGDELRLAATGTLVPLK